MHHFIDVGLRNNLLAWQAPANDVYTVEISDYIKEVIKDQSIKFLNIFSALTDLMLKVNSGYCKELIGEVHVV